MKSLAALTALAAALALGACVDNDAEDAGTETAATETVAVPATSETTIVREVEGEDGDRVSIDEDGVRADIDDGDTRVRADIDRDPSLTVETD